MDAKTRDHPWWLMLLLSCFMMNGHGPPLAAQQNEGKITIFPKTADLPDWKVQHWETVIRQDIYYFAWYSAPLGDINGDGYDDFAISSKADTTFIFLGGDPLDHEPDFIVRGGGVGITSGDINRDGRIDLVTAVDDRDWTGEHDPEQRGALRVYLQKEDSPHFDWKEDLLITGVENELVGALINEHSGSVHLLDYNGDGWIDILTKAVDTRDSAKWKGVLYFGGPPENGKPAFHNTYDAEFRLPQIQRLNQPYMLDILIGDINGDSCDDVLIWSMLAERIEYWDLYLGNTSGRVDGPDHILRADIGWSPQKTWSALMDIDADGYADIIDAGKASIRRPLGDVPVFHGRAELPQTILPDDSIPNYNPDRFGDLSPQIACHVGDMNGDGTDDLCMAWNPALGLGTSAWYFYPGGREFRTPLGYFGINPHVDFVGGAVYPVGDVNGDGYDDIVVLGNGSRHGINCRFMIFIGAPQLATATQEQPLPTEQLLTIAPNPAVSHLPAVTVNIRGLNAGPAKLVVWDLLGRRQHASTLDVTGDSVTDELQLPSLPAGIYMITVQQGSTRLQNELVLY